MKLAKKDYYLVGLQILIFILFYFDLELIDLDLPSWLNTIALIVSVIGFIICIVAVLQLNENLSPFPTPKNGSQLITNGLYRLARHPIYSGIIIAFTGFSIYSESLFRMLITLILIVLFNYKSIYEEQLLLKRFPEYDNYRNKTGRFFPKMK